MMNFDVKIFNKMLANQMQQHIKKLIHHPSRLCPVDSRLVKLTQIYKYNPSHKQKQKQKPMIISIDAEKAFNKIQQPFMLKTLDKLGIDGTYFKIIKAIYDQPQPISY